MENAQHRHDVSDEMWGLLESLLPGREGRWGGVAEDNRHFVNGLPLGAQDGGSWRDLPSDYGDWNSAFRRFGRWRDNRTWEKVLEAVVGEPDFEWLMTGATFVKLRQHGAGAVGGNQAEDATKGRAPPRHVLPRARMVCRSDSLSRQALLRNASMLSR